MVSTGPRQWCRHDQEPASASDSPGSRIVACGGRREPADELGERARRHPGIVAPPDARRGQRAPVDRHRHARLQQRDGACRPFGVEMTGPDLRPPAPYRHQRDVELAGQVAHPVEEVGVAEERDARAALDDVAHRRRLRPDREAAPVVLDGDHPHAEPTDVQALAWDRLDGLVAGPAAHQLGTARRRDHRRAGGQPAQRGEVEVVVVGVRDQHRGDAVAGPGRGRRGDAPDMTDPRAQQRVGEQPGAVELDQRGGVPDVGDRIHARQRLTPRRACRAGAAPARRTA